MMKISDLYKIYQQHPMITTDSRNCPQGSIFLALKGASFDGNRFATMALEKGCSYVIVDNPAYFKADDCRYILTDNCLKTYKELAREHRRQFHIPVIGITGTNGKTTTKELISTVLEKKYHVMHTEGNFNNDVGVPKTLFRLSDKDEIAVIEMGASHPGDIKKLIDYAEPTCGLITNVGRAHLQGFGSFEGVKKTKGELYDFLKAHQGLVFINHDNTYLMQMAQERNVNDVVYYGQKENTDLAVYGSVVSCAPFLKFTWTSGRTSQGQAKKRIHTVQTQLIGAYNLDNMLAAITIGKHFGISDEKIDDALTHYIPSNNRSQLTVTPHNHLVVDAYNANPSSMKAAIEAFRLMDVPDKMAILGDMRELGAVSGEEHQKVIEELQMAGITNVWLVGPEFEKTNSSFRKFKNVEEVKTEITRQQPHGHYILIKGSNGIKLFELPQLL
jgi:UDP-N-acetylmuramoyl-tripeptide--D-alanyl-D-alanine ligase